MITIQEKNQHEKDKSQKIIKIVEKKIKNKYDIVTDELILSFMKVYIWENENINDIYNIKKYDEIDNLSYDSDKKSIINNNIIIKKEDIPVFKLWFKFTSDHKNGIRDEIKNKIYEAEKEHILSIDFIKELSEVYKISTSFLLYIIENKQPYNLSLNERIEIFCSNKKEILKHFYCK